MLSKEFYELEEEIEKNRVKIREMEKILGL